jgi:hypothetical protein
VRPEVPTGGYTAVFRRYAGSATRSPSYPPTGLRRRTRAAPGFR